MSPMAGVGGGGFWALRMKAGTRPTAKALLPGVIFQWGDGQ